MFIKVSFCFILLYNLSFVNTHVITDPELKLFNGTHMELSFKYKADSKIIDYFNITTDVVKYAIIDYDLQPYFIKKQMNQTDDYKVYIEYDEGVEYVVTIRTCTQKLTCNSDTCSKYQNCKTSISLYITTPINIMLDIKCKHNTFTVDYSDEYNKNIKGNMHLCISNIPLTEDQINIHMFPIQYPGLLEACYIWHNEISCNMPNVEIYGLIQDETDVFPLKINVTKHVNMISNSFLTIFIIMLLSACIFLYLQTTTYSNNARIRSCAVLIIKIVFLYHKAVTYFIPSVWFQRNLQKIEIVNEIEINIAPQVSDNTNASTKNDEVLRYKYLKKNMYSRPINTKSYGEIAYNQRNNDIKSCLYYKMIN